MTAPLERPKDPAEQKEQRKDFRELVEEDVRRIHLTLNDKDEKWLLELYRVHVDRFKIENDRIWQTPKNQWSLPSIRWWLIKGFSAIWILLLGMTIFFPAPPEEQATGNSWTTIVPAGEIAPAAAAQGPAAPPINAAPVRWGVSEHWTSGRTRRLLSPQASRAA